MTASQTAPRTAPDCRLYLITPPVLPDLDAFAGQLEAALGAGDVAALQIRLMDTAGDAQTLAAALNHSAFNLANALGAWLGGVAIAAGLGWTSTGPVGVLLAFGGLAVFAASMWMRRRTSARGAAHA